MKIGNRDIGAGYPVFLIAEIGINHNGDLSICRQLIEAAAEARFDAVKFQTRTLSEVYTQEELDKPRESPFGATNYALKKQLELSPPQYRAINAMCEEHGLLWFSSCWDVPSVFRIEPFDPPCYKIASASLTDQVLLRNICSTGKPIILSTGMSTISEIDRAVSTINEFGNDLLLMHSTSTYPCPPSELNLRCIDMLFDLYRWPVGYSGHEAGLTTTFAAVARGAVAIERHVTLDRTMFGSDQAASIEPRGMKKLVDGIRTIERALGDGCKRVYDSELPAREKLRRV